MEGKKYCANCGNELNADAKFCGSCGTDVKPEAKTNTTAEASTTTETEGSFTDSIIKNNPFPSIFKSIKEFTKKHKKVLIISASAVATLIIGLVIFNAVWDFTKIEWDESFEDIKLDITSGKKLVISAKAEDRDKKEITDIKYEVSGGKISVEDKKATWILPDENGEYTITAKAPSGKAITKSIKKVFIEEDSSKNLSGLAVEKEDENADNDNDGLTNAEEKKNGTNKNRKDTDMDGLIDKYELEVSKTDPVKEDTDGDGLLDGDEIALGLDPLKADSKGDGKKDGERELTYKTTENGVSVEITGTGNIASTSVDIINNSTFKDVAGLSDIIYNFSTSGKLKNAKVTISYNEANLTANGINENDLTLYYLNDETKELEKVSGEVVNTAANTITVELKHFSKYVLGSKDAELKALSANIVFVIDNSVSMYTEQQIKDAGYESATNADGNDKEFRRLSLTKNMIDKLTGNYIFSVAEFSGNYVNLQGFTHDKGSAKAAVDKMRSNWNSNARGTNIISALKEGIDEFNANDKNVKYVILLTDGENTSGSLSDNVNEIISKATEKNVKVCSIGLGDKIDTADLSKISKETGCNYYNANNAEQALEEIYNTVASNVGYNYVDTDNDNSTDSMIIADSGFLATRDGFSFRNFATDKTPNGNCFGMASFANARYRGILPETLPYRKIKYGSFLTIIKDSEITADGYSLKNTYFVGDGNLYDYTPKTPGLALLLSNEPPADMRDHVENGTFMFKEEYMKEFEKIGADVGEKEGTWNDTGFDFTKYQTVKIGLNNTLILNAERDDSSVLNAIYRLYITQLSDEHESISFSSEPDKAWEELNKRLSSGDPTVIGIRKKGGHAVNAIKLSQDNDDPNKFTISIYDNNHPGETKTITMTRKKNNGIAWDYTYWTNEYSYTFEYNDVEDVRVSIEPPTLQ